MTHTAKTTPPPQSTTSAKDAPAAGGGKTSQPKRELKGMSFAEGERALSPVQKTAAGDSGRVSEGKADQTFDKWLAQAKNAVPAPKDPVQWALDKTIAQIGPTCMPEGYVPPPRRPSKAAPPKKENNDPLGIGAAARGPSAENPDGHHGTDEAGNKACLPAGQDAGGNPVTEHRPATSTKKAPAGAGEVNVPAAEEGSAPMNEVGLPLQGPFGGSVTWDLGTNLEVGGKMELAKLPELAVSTAPVPLLLKLKPEVAGTLKGTTDKTGKLDLTIGVEASVTASLGFGVSEFHVSSAFKLKGGSTIGAVWERGKGWSFKPFESKLTGTPVLIAEAGPVEFERPMGDEYELAILRIAASTGVTFSKGKDCGRLYDDAVKLITPASNEVGPDHGTSGSHP